MYTFSPMMKQLKSEINHSMGLSGKKSELAAEGICVLQETTPIEPQKKTSYSPLNPACLRRGNLIMLYYKSQSPHNWVV